jgi:ABC-type multidrug transport system fused ATPase/permease subunit
LNTIADYDRILVMQAGCLVEQGPPALLLADASSYFCRIASEMGPEEMAALRAQANHARA